jgi:rhamnosyltransferase
LAEKSVAIHSHNYTPKQAYKRAKGDAIAVAQAGNVPNMERAWHRDVFLPAIKDTLRDLSYLRRQGKMNELWHAFRVRYQQRLGRMHGYREGCSKG